MKKSGIGTFDRSTLSTQLGLCAAALGGTAATATNAEAAIVSFTTPITVPNTFSGVYVNLSNGTTGTSSALAGWDFNPYGTGTQIGFFWNNTAPSVSGGVAATTTGPYLDLPAGTVVDGTSTFSSTITGTTGSPYLTTGTHTLGFRFFNETTSAINFGYLTMTNTGTTGFPATIDRWSFEDNGGPITVTAVPEPASMLLTASALAAGACGMRRWRRQSRTPQTVA